MTDSKNAERVVVESLYWKLETENGPQPGRTVQTRYIGGTADGMVVTTNEKPEDAFHITEQEYKELTLAQNQQQATLKSTVRARNEERVAARRDVISKIALATGLSQAEIELL